MLFIARSRAAAIAALGLLLAPVSPASANNFAESLGWQFLTPADLAAQAEMRDMIERRRGGGYAAPSYTTNVARQYNCAIAATATGNQGTQTAVANSPAITGATAAATGNAADTATGDRAGGGVDTAQTNAGAIGARVSGGTTSILAGTASQALNSTQSNSGMQSASVRDASACAFGVLN